MITNFEILAVVLSFMAGVSTVVARTLNAKLADKTSVGVSTFYNYVIGLSVAIIVLAILGNTGTELTLAEATARGFSANWYIYLGGLIGVGVVTISNITVVKVSAFYLTLLIFVGQVFTGIFIDMFIDGELSVMILIGGILVALGLCANLFVDRKRLNT